MRTPQDECSADLFKSKASIPEGTSALDAAAKAKAKLGLLAYPVLQAADVLVHG